MKHRLIRLTLLVVVLGALGFVGFKWTQRPDNAIFGPVFSHGPRTQRLIALTFDDGPNPPYTDAILTMLERNHIHATFFVVGAAVVAHRQTIAREAHDGDAIENHAWSHEHLLMESVAAVRRSLARTNAAIMSITGVRPRFMRPPFGQRDPWVLQAARREGLVPVLWSVPLAYDWENPPAALIASRILTHVHAGDIFVLHDGDRGVSGDRSQTVRAAALIVAVLKARGYTFVTVPELMRRSCRLPGGSHRYACALDHDARSARTGGALDRGPSRHEPQ